jgi:hypothetical protein
MALQEGGCLCGGLRFAVAKAPLGVTVCHCRFCQRATGSAYMVEPVFAREDVVMTRGEPATFALRSEGSGKTVRVHFCAGCGTKLFLTFERFPTSCGVYAGTFDDPDWIAVDPATSKHIFAGVARHETLLPPGVPVFDRHATENDGTPNPQRLLDEPTRAASLRGTPVPDRTPGP